MNDYAKAVMEDQRQFIKEFICDMQSFDITNEEIVEIVKEAIKQMEGE